MVGDKCLKIGWECPIRLEFVKDEHPKLVKSRSRQRGLCTLDELVLKEGEGWRRLECTRVEG